METKKFKCKDEVIYRDKNIEEYEWTYGIFSHSYKDDGREWYVINGEHLSLKQWDILHYEGNEHLVGTQDEPETEVKLEKEYIFVCDRITSLVEEWSLRNFDGCWNGLIQAFNNAKATLCGYKYAIRCSDFNPNDMEETRKHILCVKGGKVVKYKG